MPLAFTTGTSSRHRNILQKRKFEIQIFLLLYILIPGVMLSAPFETINPWLRACDLKQHETKGSCAAPRPPRTTTIPTPDTGFCPIECSLLDERSHTPCLAYLDENRKFAICNFMKNGVEWLKSFLRALRLPHCCEYDIFASLPNSQLQKVYDGKDECYKVIDDLWEVDNLAARLTCEFSEILNRYDCRQPFSIKYSCNDCLESYRRWVCSTLIPFFNNSVRIRPCRSVCEAVERTCPYFLPENRAPSLPTQYAGEPTFLCLDPNIPETVEQQLYSLYPDDSTCCVKICGSIKNGLCVDEKSKCKREKLTSYEEALDQIVECAAPESFETRVPNTECTASEPYSSPHKLGSGGQGGHPWPTLIFLSACLNQTFTRGLNCSLLFLLIYYYYYLSPFSLLNVFVSLIAISGDFTRIYLFLTRFKAGAKLFFRFLKRFCLFLNYRKFVSQTWQYYSILISVNLFDSLIKNSQLLITPFCFFNGFAIIKKSLPARRFYYYFYYFYYNYYCYLLYYNMLSKIAQKSNNVLHWKKFRDIKRGRLNLVGIKSCQERKFISIKNDSLTIDRVNESSHIYKTISLIRMKQGTSGARKHFSSLSRGRTKKKKDIAVSVTPAPTIGLYGGTLSGARVDDCRIYSLGETEVENVQKFKLNHVISSDPKFEFQTMS